MRNSLLLIGAIALTMLCWGMYGTVLKSGQFGMSLEAGHPALLRPFVCVGLAYFLIGVVVPSLWLHFRGEKGEWTVKGIVWSLAGGALGAIGALGIVLAFKFGGKPLWVMPLVFGGAPVVNAFLTIYLARSMKDIGPLFLAGLIITVIGAVIVLLSGPRAPSPAEPVIATTTATAAEAPGAATSPAPKPVTVESTLWHWVCQLMSIALALGSWGAYGPVLHIGQAGMQHSRLRPLLCVGLAYFLIAVIVPNMILAEFPEPSSYARFGTLMALMGGAFGAIGALGIILAFNFGGKPVYVMPLVFGGAPVVNTILASISIGKLGELGPLFLAGLILVIAGSVMVLVLAPRGEKSPEPRVQSPEPEKSAGDATSSSGS